MSILFAAVHLHEDAGEADIHAATVGIVLRDQVWPAAQKVDLAAIRVVAFAKRDLLSRRGAYGIETAGMTRLPADARP